MEIEKLTVGELTNKGKYEGIVKGVPTGMYADRASYGNVPILILILDGKLPCKFRAIPYTHRLGRTQRKKGPLESLTEETFVLETDKENEMLGIAAAFVNQSIGKGDSIEIYGSYENGIFDGQFLRVGNIGFSFPGYKHPLEESVD